jgi:phosphoserine phosphatase
MTRVVLVRHGQSTWNAQGWVQGRSDLSVLTQTGEEQAEATAKFLKDVVFSVVYASPLKRARRTAEIIVGERQAIAFESDLMEINLPGWEGLDHSQLAERFPVEHHLWKEAPEKLDIDGFKPIVDLWEQARRFWARCLAADHQGCVLVVAHNAINKALISTALGMPESRYGSLLQSNCGVSVLNFDATGFATLESLNLTAHTGKPIPAQKSGTRLLLVRHGETDWNRQERFQGQIDVPLNSQGEQQANCAAEFLKEIALDHAFSSHLLRPKATAEKILQFHPGIALELVPDLQEISHGQWEGKFKAQIEAEFPGQIAQWQTRPESIQMPDGENLQQVWDRVVPAWQKIVESIEGQTGLVVAHDAVNKTIVASVLGCNPADFWRFKQGNGSVTVIDYPKGSQGMPQLSAANITSFLGGVFDCTAAGAL